MAYNIGLNIVEVDGSATPAIVGAATSVAAFNIITRRGVPNRAIRITSYPDFEQRFGGYFPGGYGAYLIKGFFDNGGQTAYVNRVIASDASTGTAPAALTLDDAASNDTLTLEGGFRGEEDPGSWGDDLYVRVTPRSSAQTSVRETAPATTSGSALTPPVNMGTFPALSVNVDGEASPTQITFQASDFANPAAATLTELRDAINRRTSKLVASLSGNQLVLTSTGQVARIQKSFTRLQVTTANPTLGFAAMASPVTGTAAARTTTGTTLAEVSSLVVGDALRVSDGTNTALVKLMSVNALTGAVTWAPAIAGIATYDAVLLRVSKVEFDLGIARGGGDADHLVETWTGLSMETDVPNHVEKVLNDPLRGSRYLVATDAGSPATVGADLPVTSGFVRLNPGRDGTPTTQDFIGGATKKTGLHAFDSFDVQLVTTERTDAAILAAGLAYCANRGDCMYVGAVPEATIQADLSSALSYGQAFQGKKVYGALYGPWIIVQDPIGTGASPLKKIPPVGHVMGVFARTETARGIWKAPAGDEANLSGALDVEYRLSDAENTDLVKNGSINGIRAVPRAGIVVDASRTLSTDTRWLYVNVRLLFNYVKSSLKQGLRWVRQEPNRDGLWNAIRIGTVTPFLMSLWRQGAFGTGTPQQVFTVICDATNNPPSEVDQGNLNVEVYFYPSKPAETIVVKVGQQPSGATAAEA
ncbi:phage tail sheath subtilisin-like domain-containing protein [Corallococcus interemptor]|uniref:phage tail sheath family protein n=1 Tax=Corallococcus interemptor TaxID=2316720 RepID=UPI0035D3DBAE